MTNHVGNDLYAPDEGVECRTWRILSLAFVTWPTRPDCAWYSGHWKHAQQTWLALLDLVWILWAILFLSPSGLIAHTPTHPHTPLLLLHVKKVSSGSFKVLSVCFPEKAASQRSSHSHQHTRRSLRGQELRASILLYHLRKYPTSDPVHCAWHVPKPYKCYAAPGGIFLGILLELQKIMLQNLVVDV